MDPSLLDRARNTTVVDNVVDLTPIREFVRDLPDRAGVSEELNQSLDELSAIIFHIQFHTRRRAAEEWFRTHPHPEPHRTPSTATPRRSTDDLLSEL